MCQVRFVVCQSFLILLILLFVCSVITEGGHLKSPVFSSAKVCPVYFKTVLLHA
jgi:hypothetical protein